MDSFESAWGGANLHFQGSATLLGKARPARLALCIRKRDPNGRVIAASHLTVNPGRDQPAGKGRLPFDLGDRFRERGYDRIGRGDRQHVGGGVLGRTQPPEPDDDAGPYVSSEQRAEG